MTIVRSVRGCRRLCSGSSGTKTLLQVEQHRGIAKHLAIGGGNDCVLVSQMAGYVAGFQRHPETQNFLKWKLELASVFQ